MKYLTNSAQKRDSVKNNYNLIAKEYSEEFGKYIEDLDVYEEFQKNLKENAKILDLGAGSGRTYSYFNEKGYQYVGLDFSTKMRDFAYKIHGEFTYIVDDMVNIKKHFSSSSVDGIFAVYSLFHLPTEDLKKLLTDIYEILKKDGIFLLSYQLGQGEEMVDEPYLKQVGNKSLYMNYQTNEEIMNFLNEFSYKKIYMKEKIETCENAINSNKITTVFLLLKKK